MTAYCTNEEVADVLPEYDSSNATELASMDRIRVRASRRIDAYLGTPPFGSEWFPAGGAAAARVFYGQGTPYLYVGAFTDATILSAAVTMPSGYTVPAFAVRDGYLVTVDSLGVRYGAPAPGFYGYSSVWPFGVPVTITATWGHPAAASGTSGVPADVVQACIYLCVAEWRQRDADPEVAGDVGKSFRMPEEAKRILDERRNRVAVAGVA